MLLRHLGHDALDVFWAEVQPFGFGFQRLPIVCRILAVSQC